jgi:hypothetical protein
MRDSYVLLNDMCVRVWCVCVCVSAVCVDLSFTSAASWGGYSSHSFFSCPRGGVSSALILKLMHFAHIMCQIMSGNVSAEKKTSTQTQPSHHEDDVNVLVEFCTIPGTRHSRVTGFTLVLLDICMT